MFDFFKKKVKNSSFILTDRKDGLWNITNPKFHNFLNNGWGHECILKPINENSFIERRPHYTGHGWCLGIKVGDYIVKPAKKNPRIYLRVYSIKYCHDPTDMFFLTVLQPTPEEYDELEKAFMKK